MYKKAEIYIAFILIAGIFLILYFDRDKITKNNPITPLSNEKKKQEQKKSIPEIPEIENVIKQPKKKLKSPEQLKKDQPKRLKYIQNLIENGYFVKLDTTHAKPQLWIEKAFYTLPKKKQEIYVGLTALYCFIRQDSHDLLEIYEKDQKVATYDIRQDHIHWIATADEHR